MTTTCERLTLGCDSCPPGRLAGPSGVALDAISIRSGALFALSSSPFLSLVYLIAPQAIQHLFSRVALRSCHFF